MKIIKILLFLSLNIINAQDNFSLNVGKIEEKNYHTSFVFENINDKIIIDVKINNQIKKFILDTGAPTSISENFLSEIKHKKVNNLPVHDANGKENKLEVVQIPEFSINGLIFSDTYALKIVDMSFFDCFNVVGIIGSNSLRNSVVEFDFLNKKITISSNLNSFNYPKNIKPNKLYFKDYQSTPILSINMKLGYINITEEVMFDSGDNDFYSLSNNNYSQFMTKINEKKIPKEFHNINSFDLLGIIASSNGSFSSSLNGNANYDIYYKFKIQEFIFNDIRFDNIISTTTYGSNSRIGSEILNHGKLTLDYKKKKYYFQPYHSNIIINVNHKFKSFYPTFENNKFIVGIVWDDAIRDHVNVGDEILIVNDIDFTKLSKCEIMKMSFEDFKELDKLKITLKDLVTHETKIIEVVN